MTGFETAFETIALDLPPGADWIAGARDLA
jgi:hypothetical protein